MEIEEFVDKSIGEWRSMRSGHSLAFQHFEEVISKIKIKLLAEDDQKVLNCIKRLTNRIDSSKAVSPFLVSWEAESNWGEEIEDKYSSGECILVPIPSSHKQGVMLRSVGYAEETNGLTSYQFLEDGTFSSITKYDQTIAEEKIWFVSKNLRCRSSVIRLDKSSAVIQTSHASEIRRLDY